MKAEISETIKLYREREEAANKLKESDLLQRGVMPYIVVSLEGHRIKQESLPFETLKDAEDFIDGMKGSFIDATKKLGIVELVKA